MAIQEIFGGDILPEVKDKINYNFAQFTLVGGSLYANLNALGDVQITSVQNGQILKYNSVEGKWVNVADTGQDELKILSIMEVI